MRLILKIETYDLRSRCDDEAIRGQTSIVFDIDLRIVGTRWGSELKILIPVNPLGQTRPDVLRDAAAKFSRKLQWRIERVSSFFFIIQR